MDAIRQEIATEMGRTRLDKDKLYDIINKLTEVIEKGGFGAAAGVPGARGPAGAPGPQGPRGKPGEQGPAGTCECKCVSKSVAATAAPKKTRTTTTKKSTTTTTAAAAQ